MKNLIIAAAFLSAPSAFANMPDVFGNMPSNVPTKSEWAIGMVQNACDIDLDARQLRGTITKVTGGVVYRVFNERGDVVAAASARNTSIFAKKTCIKK
jgi:hypothetical protein